MMELPWLSMIRGMKEAGFSDAEIVNALLKLGESESERIETEFSIRYAEYAQDRKRRDRAMNKLAREVREIGQ